MIIRKKLQPVEIKTKWYLSGRNTILKSAGNYTKTFYVNVEGIPTNETVKYAMLKADVSPLSPLPGVPMDVNMITCRYDPQAKPLKEKINALHLNGNVDLTNRPKILKADMIAKGYTDVTASFVTLYPITYTWTRTVEGQNVILATVSFTPIKSNGTVYTRSELDAYVSQVLNAFRPFTVSKLQQGDSEGLIVHILSGNKQSEMNEIAEKASELSDAYRSKSVRSTNRNITIGLESIEGEYWDFASVIKTDGTYSFKITQHAKISEAEEGAVNPDTSMDLDKIIKNSLYPEGTTFPTGSDRLKNVQRLQRVYESMTTSTSTNVACSSVMTLTNMELLIYTGSDAPVFVDGKIVVDIKNDDVISDSICLYDAGETDFKGNGIAVLHPNSCIVSETAGSNYSLSMEYPIADKKWTLIRPGRLICAPVPQMVTPQFELADVTFWRVKSTLQAKVYERPCVSYVSGTKYSGSGANLLTTGSDGVNGNGHKTTITTNDDTETYHTHWEYTPSGGGDTITVSGWQSGQTYHSGEYVEYAGYVYQLQSDILAAQGGTPAPPKSGLWTPVESANLVYDKTTHTPDKKKEQEAQIVSTQVYVTLPSNWVVTVVSVVNTFWVSIRTTYQNRVYTGYVQTECLTEVNVPVDDNEKIVAPRTIKKQAFRINNVSVDTSSGTLTVNAMHKSYDMAKTMLGDCELEQASPSLAIAVIQTSEMIVRDKRLIATNITSDRDEMYDFKNNVSGDWSWDNALAALLDENQGLVFLLKAQLIRDNDDFFLLKNVVSENPAFTFSARSNLIGVNWTIDDSEVVTRIIPKGEDKNGNTLLIDNIYVDSANANDYSEYRCEILDTGYKIGEYVIIDGQCVLLEPGKKSANENRARYYERKKAAISERTGVTSETVYNLMKKKAQERFDKDKAHLIKHSVEIDFMMLGDTIEYAPVKALGEARMYDTVRVKIPEIELDINMQVNGYEWDCTNPKKPFLRSLTLSDAYRDNEWPVSGMRIKNGTISLNKLSRKTREEFYRYSNKTSTRYMDLTIKQLKSYADTTFQRKQSGGGTGLGNDGPNETPVPEYLDYQIEDEDIPVYDETLDPEVLDDED